MSSHTNKCDHDPHTRPTCSQCKSNSVPEDLLHGMDTEACPTCGFSAYKGAMNTCRECLHSRPGKRLEGAWLCFWNKKGIRAIWPDDPRCDDFQQNSPKELVVRERKPIQLIEVEGRAVALCDDGTMWKDQQEWDDKMRAWKDIGWEQLNPIPQDK